MLKKQIYRLLYHITGNEKFKKKYKPAQSIHYINTINNKVVIVDENEQISDYITNIDGLNITFEGSDNKVILNNTSIFDSCNIVFKGNGNKIEIGEYFNGKFDICFYENNANITIGSNCRVIGFNASLLQNDTLTIGNNCMFSGNVQFWFDGHSVLDNNTKELLNPPVGNHIIIGNKVWLGMNTFITKKAKVPDYCIVGACSVVTKPFEECNSLIAGNPAQIKKRGIDWHGLSPKIYQENFDIINKS